MIRLLKILVIIFISLNFFSAKLKAQVQTDTLFNIGVLIENSISQGDTGTFENLFNKESFIQRFFYYDSLNNFLLLDSSSYFAINNNLDLPKTILTQIQNTGYYNFIKYYIEGDYAHILFRYYNDGSINYHLYLLTKIEDEYKIIDLFVFFTGEYYSKTLFNLFQNLFDNYGNINNLSFQSENDITEIRILQTHIRNENYQYALNQYNRLSEEFRNSKQMMLYRILITQNLSEDEYSKTLFEFQELFPNDPSLYLLSIDGYILQKRYEDALESIDSLDSQLGGDDFLDYYRGNIYYLKRDFEKAEIKYSSLVNNYPNFYDAYESLLFLYIEQEKNAQAVSVLENITTKFSLPKEQLIMQIKNDFQKFSKSREFKQWEKFD